MVALCQGWAVSEPWEALQVGWVDWVDLLQVPSEV